MHDKWDIFDFSDIIRDELPSHHVESMIHGSESRNWLIRIREARTRFKTLIGTIMVSLRIKPPEDWDRLHTIDIAFFPRKIEIIKDMPDPDPDPEFRGPWEVLKRLYWDVSDEDLAAEVCKQVAMLEFEAETVGDFY